IRVVTDLDPLPKIWADAHQLQQVLLNLFSNAIHAMKSTGRDGVLTVRSAGHDSGISIVVEDNGPGIRPEHLGQVFDPFLTTKGRCVASSSRPSRRWVIGFMRRGRVERRSASSSTGPTTWWCSISCCQASTVEASGSGSSLIARRW